MAGDLNCEASGPCVFVEMNVLLILKPVESSAVENPEVMTAWRAQTEDKKTKIGKEKGKKNRKL